MQIPHHGRAHGTTEDHLIDSIFVDLLWDWEAVEAGRGKPHDRHHEPSSKVIVIRAIELLLYWSNGGLRPRPGP